MEPKKHCQMKTEDGLEECGYLIGAVCKADKKKPFIVTGDFHRKLEIVGCQSFNKYLEWSDDGQDTLRELQVEQVGARGNNQDPEGSETTDALPVYVLQEGSNDSRRNPRRKKPTGHIMTHQCEVCGQQAIIHEEGTTYYCYEHHAMHLRGMKKETMKKLQEEKK